MARTPRPSEAGDASLDWLPERAVEVARAVQPVLAALHRDVPLDELAQKAGGFTCEPAIVGVRAVAAAYGLEPSVRSVTPADIASLALPFVAIGADGSDAPIGVAQESDRHLVSAIDPVTALTFEPGREFLASERALGGRTVLGRRMRASTSGYLLAVLAGVTLAIPGVIVSGLARTFVNKYLVDGSDEWLDAVLMALVIAAVLQIGLSALQQSAMTRVSRKLSITMSADYLWHLLRLPIPHFVSRPAGDLAFLMNLNDRTATQLGRQLTLAIMSFVVAVINGVFLARYSGWLMIVVLALTVCSFAAVRLISRQLRPLNLELTTAQGAVMGIATGGIASIESLKANGAEESLFARWAASYDRAVQLDQRIGVVWTALDAVPTLSTLLITAAVVGIGAAQVISGSISLGDLVGFQSLLFPFLAATGVVLGSVTLFQKVVTNCRKLDETYRESIDTSIAASETLGPTTSATKLAGSLELRGISFGYESGGAPLIEDFSLRVEPGARVALVGGSGSGKSTIARLVTGQLEPWSGEILFDGRPRHQHPPAEIAHSVAFVQQEIYLFDGTVAENLTLWDPTIPEHDYVRAATDACIHDEVISFPGGYETRILEGGRNLSGGQRQRIEIARALARNPRLLILDEATSALDSVTESVVDANLRRRGCTCLIVAHRLSTIRDCDEIVVLERGKVVERGTHDALMATAGAYAHLVGDMAQ